MCGKWQMRHAKLSKILYVITAIILAHLMFFTGCGKNPLLGAINKEQPTSELDAKPEPDTNTQAVSIKNFAFSPQSLTVSKGTTVTWTNNDSVGHTATSTSGVFDSGLLSLGKSFSYTFSNTGTYSYKCTPHPYMTGSIIVQ